jgi:NAD(P)-dependent dehydrogenase (short-subunit alcohol dehydrogenase family)
VAKLDGKVGIITGGASGIGAATVRLFVQEGANVVIADKLDDRGKCLAEELGEKTLYFKTDVRQEADVKAVIEHAVSKFGRLDVLFNNAKM